MTSNPLYNALIALLYIIFIVVVINTGSRLMAQGQENLLIPMGMLALFVLSAATMGYIFFYQPVILLLDGKRKEAVSLFARTIAAFAVITFVLLLAAVLIFK